MILGSSLNNASAITLTDASTNIVNLNATSGLRVYKPAVATAMSLSVTDICSGSIVLTGASQGKLYIGSSTAASQTITVGDAGSSNSYVNIGGNGGDGLQINGGKSTPGNNKCIVYTTAPSGGTLQIGSSYYANPSAILVTDASTNIVNLNATSGLRVYKPTVATAMSLSVTDICSGSIVLTDVSNGKLTIGSSIAASNTLMVSDTGANTGNVTVGGNGGSALLIQGGTVANNYSVIRPNNTTGQLYIGSNNSGNATAINITDSATTIKNVTTTGLMTANGGVRIASGSLYQNVAGTLSYSPTVALPVATRGGGNYDFSIANYATGLYMIMLRVANANRTDSNTVNNMFSGFVYIQQISGPGTSVVFGGGAVGNGNIYTTPVVTGTLGADTIRVTQGGFNAYYSVKMLQLFSALPGFDS